MSEADEVLKEFIEGDLIDKYITLYVFKCRGNKNKELRKDTKSFLILKILESKYKEAKYPKTYITGIILHQINSTNSEYYRTYVRPSKCFPNVDDIKYVHEITEDYDWFKDESRLAGTKIEELSEIRYAQLSDED